MMGACSTETSVQHEKQCLTLSLLDLNEISRISVLSFKENINILITDKISYVFTGAIHF